MRPPAALGQQAAGVPESKFYGLFFFLPDFFLLRGRRREGGRMSHGTGNQNTGRPRGTHTYVHILHIYVNWCTQGIRYICRPYIRPTRALFTQSGRAAELNPNHPARVQSKSSAGGAAAGAGLEFALGGGGGSSGGPVAAVDGDVAVASDTSWAAAFSCGDLRMGLRACVHALACLLVCVCVCACVCVFLCVSVRACFGRPAS